MLLKCISEKIAVIQIKRSFEQLQKALVICNGRENVVGVDLPLADLDTPTLENDGTCSFELIPLTMLNPSQLRIAYYSRKL